MIRQAAQSDATEIAEIYNHYISNTTITFEEIPLSGQEMAGRIADTETEGLPWLVAESDGQVVGYAYASKWKGRCAYRYSAEVTVYLAQESTGKGLGATLYEALFRELKERSYHVVMGGIALPNPASIALHEKLGMTQVAHFKEVGFKFDQWIDVGYWQKSLADP